MSEKIIRELLGEDESPERTIEPVGEGANLFLVVIDGNEALGGTTELVRGDSKEAALANLSKELSHGGQEVDLNDPASLEEYAVSLTVSRVVL